MKFYFLFFVCLLSTSLLFAQSALLGEVYDENGESLPGATVTIENTSYFTATDAYGFFMIKNIPSGEYTVEVSYIGKKYLRQKVNIEGRAEVEFMLKDDVVIGETIVVSASRADEKMPFTFLNIDKVEIQKNNLGQDIPFLLRFTPSTVASSEAGAGIGYTNLRIRGSDGTRTNVIINDIPLNDAESQGTFLVNLPDLASSLNSIQIQRGVGTSSNGAGSFGATVNLDTKGYSSDSFVELDNSFGSFNTRKHTLSLNTGLINNHWNFGGRFSLINTDGYVDRASSDLKSAYFTGGYFGNNLSLQAIAFTGKEITYQAWNGVPEARVSGDEEKLRTHYNNNLGSIYQTAEDSINLFSSDRRYNYYLYNNQVDNYKQDHYQLHVNHQTTSNLTLNASLHYTKGKGFFEQFRLQDDFKDYNLQNVQIGDTTIQSTDLVRRRWLDNDFYGLLLNLNYNLEKIRLNFGAAIHQYDGSHFGRIIWSEYASNSELGDKYYTGESDKTDANAFLKSTFSVNDKFSLFADLQVRNVDYLTNGVDNDLVNYDIDENFFFLNPKLGFNYTIDNRSEFFASIAVGNKEPSRSDFIDALSDKSPKHETLYDIESGFKRKGDTYSFEANLYYMLYKNQLIPTGELNDVGSSLRANVDDSYRAGIELQSKVKLSEQLNLAAFASFSQNKISIFNEVIYDYTNGFEVIEIERKDTDIAYSPNVVAGAELSFSPIDNFETLLYGKFVGEQFLDNTSNENRKLDSYFVSDLLIRTNLKSNLIQDISLSLKVNNLFDLLYSSNGYTYSYIIGDEITENFLYPQAGINFLAGINIVF